MNAYLIVCSVTDGAIKLRNQANELGVGGVQFFLQEFRTLVYFNSWSNHDVLVVCRQLGYSTVDYSVCLNPPCGPINCPGGGYPGKLWRNEVHCTGQESSLIKCGPLETWMMSRSCDNKFTAASVNCAGKFNCSFIICFSLKIM